MLFIEVMVSGVLQLKRLVSALPFHGYTHGWINTIGLSFFFHSIFGNFTAYASTFHIAQKIALFSNFIFEMYLEKCLTLQKVSFRLYLQKRLRFLSKESHIYYTLLTISTYSINSLKRRRLTTTWFMGHLHNVRSNAQFFTKV